MTTGRQTPSGPGTRGDLHGDRLPGVYGELILRGATQLGYELPSQFQATLQSVAGARGDRNTLGGDDMVFSQQTLLKTEGTVHEE